MLMNVDINEFLNFYFSKYIKCIINIFQSIERVGVIPTVKQFPSYISYRIYIVMKRKIYIDASLKVLYYISYWLKI